MAQTKLVVTCKVCGTEFELPEDVMDGEITSCPTCGARYIVKLAGGKAVLEEFKGDVEDYGE
ncbi:MAG: alpha-aminoadipate/glutamate carrier protein LysW [Thermoproteus sp. AZ2]|jgi:alpha-aminoadipate carrier protein LysW|uniref:Alpha-aminoadipate/glutamate carrier protein LysW n=1 Tax=Thermoproteus sp. AZ2 TaxID=1609232 RepID=A0ACC6V1Q9_9CREN|nr:MAG: lysine biosynthesis protein [Thermoproteus sp. AZ2]